MATTITCGPNMSMSDLVIQSAGTMEASGQWCLDNNVAISDIPNVGTIYVVSDAALAIAGSAGAAVVTYLQQNGIVIGTLGNDVPVDVIGTEDGGVLGTEDGGMLGME